MWLPKEMKKLVRGMRFRKINAGKSGAAVFELLDREKTLYLKIAEPGEETTREREMYRWLKGRLPVPDILCACGGEGREYLLMEKAEGKTLESECCLRDPGWLLRRAVEGIQLLQGISVEDCPFDSTIGQKLRWAEKRLSDGAVGAVDPGEYAGGLETPQEIYQYLLENKPEEAAAFTHGDYCFNNLFVNENRISGFIDLGRAGVGDPYQDLALCVRELGDYGPEYARLQFDYLGMPLEEEKLRYYILLDELF